VRDLVRPETDATSLVDLVLKEDIAGIYDTSWQFFFEGTGECKAQTPPSKLPALRPPSVNYADFLSAQVEEAEGGQGGN